MFEHKLFANIKQHILGISKAASKKEQRKNTVQNKAIDVNKELKKNSPIELDCIKDKALQKEAERLIKIEKLLEFQKKAAGGHMGGTHTKGFLDVPQVDVEWTLRNLKEARQLEQDKLDTKRKMLKLRPNKQKEFLK